MAHKRQIYRQTRRHDVTDVTLPLTGDAGLGVEGGEPLLGDEAEPDGGPVDRPGAAGEVDEIALGALVAGGRGGGGGGVGGGIVGGEGRVLLEGGAGHPAEEGWNAGERGHIRTQQRYFGTNSE